MVRLNPHLRQNYFILMRNFKQNQHKLSNNHVKFPNLNLPCKFETPSKKSWIRPCFYHLFYFIYMGQSIWGPYGTRLHYPYGSHIGAHLGPISVLYRLLAACLDISNVPTEFNVPACVKSQSNTQKSTAPTIESKINVHGQTHEHTVCKNAYTNNYLIRLEDRQLFVKANTCLLTNDRQE